MMWGIFAGMALLSVLLIGLPRIAKAFTPPSPEQEKQKTLALYKSQLKNIQRDIDAGLLSKADAKEYQLEIERRLLQENDHPSSSGNNQRTDKRAGMTAITLPIAMVLIFSGLAYYKLGQPGYFPPTRPVFPAEIIPADGGPSLDELLGELKTFLEENPDNQEGWFRLATVSMQIRAFQVAANSFGEAAMLERENDAIAAEMFARQAEAFVFLGEGLVSPAANWSVARALEKDPAQPLALYYKGLGLFQAQEPRQALAESENHGDEATNRPIH